MKTLNDDMNADRWVTEFNETVGRLGFLIDKGIDDDFLRAWFANAIMCGYDHGARTQTERVKALETQIKIRDASDSIKIMANTRDVFRGTEVMMRYEAAEAENVRLTERISQLESDRGVWKGEAGRLFEEVARLRDELADARKESAK